MPVVITERVSKQFIKIILLCEVTDPPQMFCASRTPLMVLDNTGFIGLCGNLLLVVVDRSIEMCDRSIIAYPK